MRLYNGGLHKNAYPARKKGFVEASYNAAAAGPFMKTVNVTTSDSKTPKTLSFKGVVTAS
ncbi:DUF1573 domain-containing protein [Chryseobacterium sp. 1B4]